MGRRLRRAFSVLISALLVGVTLIAIAPTTRADALSGSDFNAGLIISDNLFYNSSAMSASEIQQFLAAKGSGLAGMSFSVSSRGAVYSDSTGNVRCGAFSGGTLSAATIIFNVQQACGISAKALLVTLQKEQGLITNASPSQAALDRAMGFACPDTAPCAPTSLGFGNQVYSGALQLNTYRASNFGRQPGLQYIPWNPNSGCGGSQVYVQNYATAALYNYTPYQPNAAALANLTGSGDGCSSYGNRNFWVYYSNWFGSPMGGTPYPIVNPIISGTTAVGATLTALAGTWGGSPTFSYAWVNCSNSPDIFVSGFPPGCNSIPGAAGSTYVTTATDVGKYVAVVVTGSNANGGMTSTALLATKIGTPVNTVAPTISGSATLGTAWTVNVGNWAGTPTPTIAVYWLRCDHPVTSGYTLVPAGCSAISGATGHDYVSTSADVGMYLTAQVSGNNSLGFSIAGTLNSVQIGFPVNTVAPTVSGSATVGSIWTVDVGTWTGVPAPTNVIYWLRCGHPVTSGYTTVPSGCVPISGATSTTYQSTMADVGSYLTAQVAGNSSRGFTIAGALNSTAVAAAAPANTVAPTVSGSATVGSTWTVNTGTWTGAPTPTIVIYWLRCSQPVTSGYSTVPAGCQVISGANGTSYVAAAADVGKYLTAQVAGNNSIGYAIAGTLSPVAIQSSFPNMVNPPVVTGSAVVGSQWTVNPGTWTGSPAPTLGIFWLQCDSPVTTVFTTAPAGCRAIDGAHSTTYAPTLSDVGKYITVQIAGTNTLGFALAGAIGTVKMQSALPANVVAPTVSGLFVVGSTWTVNTGTWSGSPAPTLAINWLRCDSPTRQYTVVPAQCQAIPGATNTTYVSTASDLGKYLTAQVAGNSSLGFSLAGAPTTRAIGSPHNTVTPLVSGSATVGATWTVDAGTWTGVPAPTLTWQWLRCDWRLVQGDTTSVTACSYIAGANSTTYVTTADDTGKYLGVLMEGTNTLGAEYAPITTGATPIAP